MSAPTRIKNFFDLKTSITENYIWRVIIWADDLALGVRDAEILYERRDDPALRYLFVTRRIIRNDSLKVFDALG